MYRKLSTSTHYIPQLRKKKRVAKSNMKVSRVLERGIKVILLRCNAPFTVVHCRSQLYYGL